jgi:VWFA-related protein
MRKLALVWLIAQFALPVFAAKRVTVAQLERLVGSDHAKSDAKIAQHLYDLELTERLTAARLAMLEATLPGPESRRSLVALADQSAFLDPPPAEIPAAPVPDSDAQRRMMTQAVDYAAKTMHQLPNLFAVRDTIRFEDSPAVQKNIGEDNVSGTFTPYQPLHPVSRSSATVLYRDGEEVLDAGASRTQAPSQSESAGLTTKGEFGPILATVLGDAAQGKLLWSHWEQGASGPEAVFRFAVRRQESHYEVEFCCLDSGVFRQFTGYHGEIALDPTNGTILRLTLIADLTKADPVAKAAIMVEYGHVELGDRTYICPVKSVSIFLAPEQLPGGIRLTGRAGGIAQRPNSIQGPDSNTAPLQTMLNEVVFDQYHLFHADARILAADNLPAAQVPAASPSVPPQPQPTVAHENIPAPGESAAATSPPAIPATITTAAPAAVPPVPELSVTNAAVLPDTPAVPAAPAASSFTLRVSTRLVDVGVTATDKKGRPVTGLEPDDFEVFDNGRKQTVRFFSPAAALAPSAPSAPEPDAEPIVFSNRLAAIDRAPSAQNAPAESSSTILLIDVNSLSFADLTSTHQQVLKFLEQLPPTERVGLYVRVDRGFKVLAEETHDRSLLTSALRQWMPNAADLARAQQEEARNRQQFDDVHSATDMQYVNGNPPGAGPMQAASPDIPGGGASATVDPNLMREGSDPARDALAMLVGVAVHLGGIPGHKNLVWIASDNVLAEWTTQAAGSDRGPNTTNRLMLRAQETLNDAHVSIYPFDASQLETAAVDSSLKDSSVQLEKPVQENTPGSTTGPNPGRITAAMQQDTHPIQAAIQTMAQATGGRIFRRSGNMVASLNNIVADGGATYLLSFAPDAPPDDQYHQLTVRLTTRSGVTLRYRTGYLYAKEPTSLRDRFRQAIWQPLDAGEIAIRAHPAAASGGAALTLQIAAADIGAVQQGDLWTDKLDIFLVRRDDTGTHARVNGQTLVLRLKEATWQRTLREGIPFDEFVDQKQDTGTIRIIVVDENSGRIGSITLPAAALTPGAG